MKIYTSLCLMMAAAVTIALFAGCAETTQYRTEAGETWEVEYASPVADTGFMTETEWKRYVRRTHPGLRQSPTTTVMMTPSGMPEVEYHCPVCDTEFVTASDYYKQKMIDAEGKVHQGPRVRVKTTVDTGSGKQTMYACPVCDTGFLTPREWERHERLHRF